MLPVNEDLKKVHVSFLPPPPLYAGRGTSLYIHVSNIVLKIIFYSAFKYLNMIDDQMNRQRVMQ